MAVASISEAIVEKGILTADELTVALSAAERAVESDNRRISDSNRAATLFPIRVLLLANQASQRGRKLSFSDYAELVGKLS